MRLLRNNALKISVLRVGLLGGLILWSAPAWGQVQADGSWGTLSQSTPSGWTISGGTLRGGIQSGGQLFHSFDRFSIGAGQTVTFQQPPNVTLANIFARVTGSQASQIDGRLQVEGNANLFLMNPNGIQFGAGASLDLRGSFVGTTAQSLTFPDGQVLSSQLNTPPPTLLRINGNIGFHLTPSSGAIGGVGSGNQLGFNADFSTDRSQRPLGVAVDPGRSLLLLGNGLTFSGANLTAQSGHLELGSVSNGTIALPFVDNQFSALNPWRLDYSDVQGFNDITFNGAASGDVSGAGGGFLRLYGRNLGISGASALLADTLGNQTGQGLELQGTASITVINDTPSLFATSLFTAIDPQATGHGGNLLISTPNLLVADGAIVGVDTFGAGSAGTLEVDAQTIELRKADWSVQTFGNATGNAGTVKVNADRFRITNGGQILARTLSAGNAGEIIFNISDLLEVTGERKIYSGRVFSSLLSASVQQGSSGDRGNITLNVGTLQVNNGGRISLETDGINPSDRAGTLSIAATQGIFLNGTTSKGVPSSISTSTTDLAPGGELRITAPLLSIQGGAQISAGTFGSGPGGNLRVNVDRLILQGQAPATPNVPPNFFRDETQQFFPSGLVTGSRAGGNGGDLTIAAQTIQLSDGAQLTVGSTASGGAGTLNLQADRILLQRGAALRGDSQAGLGNIQVNGGQLILENSDISTNTRGNQPGGNIDLTLASLLSLRSNSTIAANSSGTEPGGNIRIQTPILIAIENSDITANATNSRGGTQVIQAQSILGTVFRPALTPQSDITASSALGAQLSGNVIILTPDLDVSSGLIPLTTTPVDPASTLAEGCHVQQKNHFAVVGKGGLPDDPRQLLPTRSLLQDFRLPAPELQHKSVPMPPVPQTQLLQEATNWYKDTKGTVYLVGTQPIPLLSPVCKPLAGRSNNAPRPD